MLNRAFLTTSLELPGYRITRNLGVVRGIVVRSRNLFVKLGSVHQLPSQVGVYVFLLTSFDLASHAI